jgi:hypothetical protein
MTLAPPFPPRLTDEVSAVALLQLQIEPDKLYAATAPRRSHRAATGILTASAVDAVRHGST